MGEQTRFRPGDRAPNDGVYMETGKNDFPIGIEDPRRIELKKGDRFPETADDDRVWVLARKGRSLR